MTGPVLLVLSLLVVPVSAGTNRCLLDDSWVTKVARTNTEINKTQSNNLLPKGPYQVKTGTISKIPGLSKGGPYAGVVVYAVPKENGEKFPFISFAHGTTAGGAKTLADYAQDLEVVASYGFVIVAAESCPMIECFSGYCADQQATIRACAADQSLHPALAHADFSNVGVYGHSMGAMATIGSVGGSKSCKYDSSLNIKAAVSQHPCWDISMEASPVKIPIMFTAGSVDKICEDGCAQRFYDQIKSSPSKIMFDVSGANHFEPTGMGSNSEVPAVAYFLSCWLRNENCDKVYGSSGKAICNQIAFPGSLHECTVEGTKPTTESDVFVEGGNLNLDWSDCGDSSTHAKVTALAPTTLPIGKTTTVTGSGNTDEQVTAGSFQITAKFGPVTEHYSGDVCAKKVFHLPAFLGSITWNGLKCPVAKGSVSVGVDVQLASIIPAKLAKGDILIKASDASSNGDLICLDIKTSGAGSTKGQSPTVVV